MLIEKEEEGGGRSVLDPLVNNDTPQLSRKVCIIIYHVTCKHDVFVACLLLASDSSFCLKRVAFFPCLAYYMWICTCSCSCCTYLV